MDSHLRGFLMSSTGERFPKLPAYHAEPVSRRMSNVWLKFARRQSQLNRIRGGMLETLSAVNSCEIAFFRTCSVSVK